MEKETHTNPTNGDTRTAAEWALLLGIKERAFEKRVKKSLETHGVLVKRVFSYSRIAKEAKRTAYRGESTVRTKAMKSAGLTMLREKPSTAKKLKRGGARGIIDSWKAKEPTPVVNPHFLRLSRGVLV